MVENDARYPLSSPANAVSTPLIAFSTNDYTGIAQELIAVWPKECDLDTIRHLPLHLSTHLHMRPCTPSTTYSSGHSPTVHAVLQPPPPGLHPVLIARKLLSIASLLQGVLSMPDLPAKRQESFQQLILTVVGTVTKLVTTNDDLTCFVEGIECIMMEATIHNYAGKLHQAWRTVRRATTAAQLLGLHRDVPLSPESFLDPESTVGFDTEEICFQIMSMDRYLSMTLGLPHASHIPYAITPERLLAFEPIDRMARLQCRISEQILERTQKDLTETREIDKLLFAAAAEMPHYWWLIPDLASHKDDQRNRARTIARFNYQFAHYHLLLRLYLPFVLHSSIHAEYAPGKSIAWSACRAILSRYIAFRTWNSGPYYCRGIDFLTFIATTVLCVAHINSRSPLATPVRTSFPLTEMAHDYPTDRGMMQRALEIMQRTEHDEVASKLSKILQSLLNLEGDAANGTAYNATAVDGDGCVSEYQGEFFDEGQKLQLRIPYVGTIILQRTPDLNLVEPTAGLSDPFTTSEPTSLEWDAERSWQQAGHDDWTLQNVNQALFSDLLSGVGHFQQTDY